MTVACVARLGLFIQARQSEAILANRCWKPKPDRDFRQNHVFCSVRTNILKMLGTADINVLLGTLGSRLANLPPNATAALTGVT